ncbi:MAG: glycosyltransferase family 4 protein [Flavobacteriaceae bacterium]|nr:glycosyltransferase family 4 protein [Flavobacteriaceae bacterium]
MKILFCFTLNKSFLANFFLEMAEKLVFEGFEVNVLSLKKNDLEINIKGIHYIQKQKGGYFNNYRTIYRVIKKIKPDILISNFSYVNPALLCGSILSVKSNIAWLHTLTTQNDSSNKSIFIKRMFLKLADKIIVNSPYLHNELIQLFKINDKRIHPLPFWTTIESYTSKPLVLSENNHFKIGCPGRFIPSKNQMLIIEAMKLLDTEVLKHTKLYLAGDGPEKLSLEKYINEKCLKENVIFLGLLSAEEMKYFYEEMDVIVLPSSHEAFGLVFLEALSVAKNTLVSQNFGALSFIDKNYPNLNKIVFDPNTSVELSEKLNCIIKGDILPSEYFYNLYTHNFDKERIIQKFKDIII